MAEKNKKIIKSARASDTVIPQLHRESGVELMTIIRERMGRPIELDASGA